MDHCQEVIYIYVTRRRLTSRRKTRVDFLISAKYFQEWERIAVNCDLWFVVCRCEKTSIFINGWELHSKEALIFLPFPHDAVAVLLCCPAKTYQIQMLTL